MIIKYDSNGKAEWATSIGENGNDSIKTVAATSDGGYVVGGDFQSSTIQVEEYTLTNSGSSEGMIIKYNSENNVEWATNIGGSGYDQINSIAESQDGGYIAGGHFKSTSIQVGDYTLMNTSNN